MAVMHNGPGRHAQSQAECVHNSAGTHAQRPAVSMHFPGGVRKNGKEILKNVHQLVIPTVLEKGLIERDSYLKRITACSQCHTKKYCLNGCGPLIMCKEVFANVPDIVKTAEIFGGTPGFAARKILINQKVYQIIVDNKLDQSLLFYPIDLR